MIPYQKNIKIMYIRLFFSIEHLFRGQRKIDELKQLSKNEDDFNYRRLFIEEMELEIKYLYHWKKFTLHLSMISLLLTFTTPMFLLLTIALFFISIYFNRKTKSVYLQYKMGLDIINMAIYKIYKISLTN